MARHGGAPTFSILRRSHPPNSAEAIPATNSNKLLHPQRLGSVSESGRSRSRRVRVWLLKPVTLSLAFFPRPSHREKAGRALAPPVDKKARRCGGGPLPGLLRGWELKSWVQLYMPKFYGQTPVTEVSGLRNVRMYPLAMGEGQWRDFSNNRRRSPNLPSIDKTCTPPDAL